MRVRTCLSATLLCAASAAVAHTNERGLDARNFDASTPACSDFFQHANGTWLKTNPIPPSYTAWSLDNEIGERNLALLHSILDDAAAHPGATDSVTRKLGDFQAAAMDEKAAERAGANGLRADLDAIDALHSNADVASLIIAWQARGDAPLFDFDALPDLKRSDINIAYAAQGGIGLPDRDYYLRTDAKSRKLLAQYRKHVARMLGLLDAKDAARQADAVLALETRLAKASLDRVALRDPANSYHMMTLAQADAKTPHFSWSQLFARAGRADVPAFSMAQPEFFAAADKALADVALGDWQAWLRWRLVDRDAAYMGSRFVDADFAFNGGVLRGARQNLPRWKRAVRSADRALGELLGQAYVARVFPPQAKQRALALVENLKTAMRARIAALDWMGDDTKRAAYAKLDSMVAKIGYPDHWRDYAALPVTRDSWLANIRASRAFEARRAFAKFDKPVDRSEWDMTPQTVNAYYNPLGNEIVFPAAQLLPPYFDVDNDAALNYGGIGTVIGHEMTHAFDDQGSQFDARGNLADWWTPADRKQFEARAAGLVRQFDAYVPIDDLHINGKLTLGENIADLGGVLIAYDAFKLTAQGQSGTRIDALTPEQRFFYAYAQTWRTAQRPEQLRLQLQSNEHAPAKYRTNGALSDVPAFAQAFACKPGDPMARAAADVVAIW